MRNFAKHNILGVVLVAAILIYSIALVIKDSYGWDNKSAMGNIKIPIYVNLHSLGGDKDNLVVDHLDNWVYFKNLSAGQDIVWGFADYQRNIMGFRMDVEYQGESIPQCVLFEVNNVSYGRYTPDKLDHVQSFIVTCDSIETWFEEELNG